MSATYINVLKPAHQIHILWQLSVITKQYKAIETKSLQLIL